MPDVSMTHGSLFSGIGGFDLAADWMGWENRFHCEWNEFGRKVLDYYWPEAESFHDITKTDFKKYANGIDVLTGGFPCQPYSTAGKRLGKADDRHLWPEMLRAIREIKPRFVVAENVSGLISWNGGMVFHEVQSDLEAEGYEVIPFLIPACGINAPHKRERVWFVANTKNVRHEQSRNTRERWAGLADCDSDGDAANTKTSGIQGDGADRQQEPSAQAGQGILGCNSPGDYWAEWPTQPPIRGRNDGLPAGLDGITVSKHRQESIKAYGNAIVPHVALEIFKAIEKYMQNA
jgi:DNA (cytosine-5)-methyltransferase 1